MSASDINHRFDYHRPNAEAVTLHEGVREVLKEVSLSFDANLPDGREKSLAITKLEEAMFWANAAIARNKE